MVVVCVGKRWQLRVAAACAGLPFSFSLLLGPLLVSVHFMQFLMTLQNIQCRTPSPVLQIAITALTIFMHFPMWGSMFLPGNPNKTEEEYYSSDYTAAEREQGLHLAVSKFAIESRSNRGYKVNVEEAKEAETTKV